jgi:hypothetical protein
MQSFPSPALGLRDDASEDVLPPDSPSALMYIASWRRSRYDNIVLRYTIETHASGRNAISMLRGGTTIQAQLK